jgi:peptidyl-prolyl cis-trans isomerase D
MGIIGKIRKHSWIAVVLVGGATLAFILGDLTKNRNRVPDMGKIDGTTITDQHFEVLYNEMRTQVMRNQGLASLNSDQEFQVREQVWQNLVQETLLGEQYAKLGITLTEAELSDMYTGEFIHPYLKQMFTDPKTGVYNTSAIQYYIENFDKLDTNAKQQWVEVERTVTQDREQQKYGMMISQAMYIPKVMAKKIAEINANSSNVRVAALSFQTIKDEEAKPTEEDYKNYYNEHKAEFRVYEDMRQLDYVVFPINPTKEDYAKIETEANNTWAELQTMDTATALDFSFFVNSESDQSYDSTWHKTTDFMAPLDSIISHTAAGAYIAPRVIGKAWVMGKVQGVEMRPDSLRASTIWVMNQSAGGSITRTDAQAKAMADSVMAKLKKGTITFDEAVKQYSDNKENNGDMGWALDGGYGFLNEKVMETPVDGFFMMEHPQKYGYMIVRVTGKTTPQKKVRVAVITKNIEASEQTEKSIYNVANMFAGQNRNHAAMIAAAQEQNLQVHSDNVTRMSPTVQGVTNGREIVRWAFGDKIEKGAVADQIFNTDNAFVVCALKDVFKKGYATLEQARQFMEQPVKLEKKGTVALAKADKAYKASKDINTVATTLGTTVDTVADVTFNGYYFGKFGMEPKAQAVVAMNAMKNNKQLIAPVKGASGVYVIQIDNITKSGNGDPSGIQADMQQNMMQKSQGVLQALRVKANIEDHRDKFF